MNNSKPVVNIELNDDVKILYGSQCAVQGTSEEVFFNFSAALLSGKNPQEVTMPVHTCVATNYFCAKRILKSLSQVIEQYEELYGTIEEDESKRRVKKRFAPVTKTQAGFPQIDNGSNSE